MKVRLQVCRTGPTGVNRKGEEIDVPDDEGKRMCAAGQAVPVRQKREKAVEQQLDIEQRDG